MTTNQTVDGLPKEVPATFIPPRPHEDTITMLVFIVKNKLGGAPHVRKKLFYGRMDTNEEIRQFVAHEFSDFVTEVKLQSIHYYELANSTLVDLPIR